MQKNVIMQWIDAIHSQEAAYAFVAFRIGIQCFFPVDAVIKLIKTNKIIIHQLVVLP